MDATLREISTLVKASRRTISAQRDRLQKLEALLRDCPEVSPEQLARTTAPAAGDDDPVARFRTARDGVVTVFVALHVVAADLSSCIKAARHPDFDPAALPDLSVLTDDEACDRLLVLALPLPDPPAGLPDVFVRLQVAFTSVHLLDHHLTRSLQSLGRAGVPPQLPGTVAEGHRYLSRAVPLAVLAAQCVHVVADYCAAQELAGR
ncbi:hypothetical protein ACP70R_030307 [Stipagrostis hirtigluma subsp. patula]